MAVLCLARFLTNSCNFDSLLLCFFFHFVAITHFFEVGDGSYRIDVIKSVLAKLSMISKWMKTQDILRMFATSLLMVYEGGPAQSNDRLDSLDIRLVDFAHCYEKDDNSASDTNALYGVEIFSQFLEQVLHDLCTN